MSTTALVRSTSTSNGLTARSSSPRSAPPSTTAPTVLPKLNLTPQSKPVPTQTPTPQPSTPGTPTPGQWQHPRMKEVMQRQDATNFDKSNVWAVGINISAVVVSIAAPALAYPILPPSTIQSLRPYDTYVLLFIRAFLALNILVALAPLLRNQDACEDIPLTPAQRQLLGLPPMSRPATPAEKDQWITPPRYTRSRSATPQSPASGLRAQASASPGSGSLFGTPQQQQKQQQRQGSNSPFGSQQDSPSFHPSPRGGPAPAGSERRRLSYSVRGSPLGAVDDHDPIDASRRPESPPTPARRGAARASVGLNSKWLYEKGMGMGKGSPSRGSNGAWDPKGWGTGSVFN